MEIPKEVIQLNKQLEAANFQSYLVGGCVRDLLIGRKPGDWDIATNAKPEEIQKIFPDSVYENKFGTVGVKTEAEDPTLKIIEITTFRKEGKYTDKRHPDEITFAKTLEEDLSRRDFTINAMALEIQNLKIKNQNDKSKFKNINLIDPYNGQKDLKNKLIRAVGNPEERFQEDALRLIRGVRFATQLGFSIEEKTAKAIKKQSSLIEFIAKERIRDELEKLLLSENAAKGTEKLREVGLLNYILPEIKEGFGVIQNKHHIYTIYEHSLRSLDYAAKNNFPLDLRLAALLHDIGKPKTKEGEGPDCTFYGHQIVSAKMAVKVLDRLRFSRQIIERIDLLIREHMFVYDPETVSLAGVRRLLRRVGSENIDDLIRVREADRIGSGVPKAQPYRLRHLMAMIEKVKRDPISAKMLKINGNDVMKELNIGPGPQIGKILVVLLEEVLDEPEKNNKEYLVSRIKQLAKLTEKELDKAAIKAKETSVEVQTRIDEEIKKKYFVR
jgi:poly(A) polymerase/tRNA nucleotidyltransferase (CCA-adding enzyme)